MASVAFSRSNIINGAIATGSIKDGSGGGPSYERMLNNCPVIKTFCEKTNVSKMPELITKCAVIADEMVLEKTRNPKCYLGTPDDQRMFQSFGDDFGPIHIGTGEETSGDRVTDLEIIRWRTTLLGTDGQLEIAAQKRLEIAEKALARGRRSGIIPLAPITTAAATGECPNNEPLTQPQDTQMITGGTPLTAPPTRKGKKCSNPNCPDHAQYFAATCKTLWTKCAKNCSRCGPGAGGSMHICANAECKNALAIHMAL